MRCPVRRDVGRRQRAVPRAAAAFRKTACSTRATRRSLAAAEFRAGGARDRLDAVGERYRRQRELRASLLRVMGAAGDADAVSAARTIVDRAVNGKDTDTALLDAAFDVAARRGDKALYERIAARLPKAANVQEHYRLLYALTAFPQRELAMRTLDLMKSDVVRVNDYPLFFAQLLGNAATRDVAWSHLKANWDDLRPKVISFGGRGAIPALGESC